MSQNQKLIAIILSVLLVATIGGIFAMKGCGPGAPQPYVFNPLATATGRSQVATIHTNGGGWFAIKTPKDPDDKKGKTLVQTGVEFGVYGGGAVTTVMVQAVDGGVGAVTTSAARTTISGVRMDGGRDFEFSPRDSIGRRWTSVTKVEGSPESGTLSITTSGALTPEVSPSSTGGVILVFRAGAPAAPSMEDDGIDPTPTPVPSVVQPAPGSEAVSVDESAADPATTATGTGTAAATAPVAQPGTATQLVAAPAPTLASVLTYRSVVENVLKNVKIREDFFKATGGKNKLEGEAFRVAVQYLLAVIWEKAGTAASDPARCGVFGLHQVDVARALQEGWLTVEAAGSVDQKAQGICLSMSQNPSTATAVAVQYLTGCLAHSGKIEGMAQRAHYADHLLEWGLIGLLRGADQMVGSLKAGDTPTKLEDFRRVRGYTGPISNATGGRMITTPEPLDYSHINPFPNGNGEGTGAPPAAQ